MFPSPALVLVFTLLFAVTGLRSLARLFTTVPDGVVGADRAGEVSNLLTSIAMVGMSCGLTGGPGTPSGDAQLVLFGLLALVFVARILDRGERPRVGDAHHLLMVGAMAWMVTAMPSSPGTGDPTSHAHHGHGAATAAAGTSGAAVPGAVPEWMPAITVALVVLLAAAALAAAVEAVRRRPRVDAPGHVLMSGGMAATLLAML